MKDSAMINQTSSSIHKQIIAHHQTGKTKQSRLLAVQETGISISEGHPSWLL